MITRLNLKYFLLSPPNFFPLLVLLAICNLWLGDWIQREWDGPWAGFVAGPCWQPQTWSLEEVRETLSSPACLFLSLYQFKHASWSLVKRNLFMQAILLLKKKVTVKINMWPPSNYVLHWPKSPFSFSHKIKNMFFIFTNKFIDLDILSMSATTHMV